VIAYKTLRTYPSSCLLAQPDPNLPSPPLLSTHPARHQFGNLQHRTFPIYFSLSLGVSTALAAAWVYTHPDVAQNLSHPLVADVAQLYALAFVGLAQAVNLFVVGPITSK
jgi:hypothetical protein